MEKTKHILSIQVRNKPGVMSQVCGLFTRRGYNIDSIAVGVTDDPQKSTISIVLRGSDNDLSQFRDQLLKLPDLIQVKELAYHDCIVRELLLARVKVQAKDRAEVFGIVEVFGGTIVEITKSSMLIEAHGNGRRINSLISMLGKFHLLEVARTGQVALAFDSPDT